MSYVFSYLSPTGIIYLFFHTINTLTSHNKQNRLATHPHVGNKPVLPPHKYRALNPLIGKSRRIYYTYSLTRIYEECLKKSIRFFKPEVKAQPFIEPIITPLTKYFCANGYNAIIGAIDTTINEYFNSSAKPCLASAVSGSSIIAAVI